MSAVAPRRSVELSFTDKVWAMLRDMRGRLDALERGASLRNAAISGGQGLKVYGEDRALRISLNTTDGAVVAYTPEEEVAARFGPLQSAPGEYGVEVNVGGTLVQLGYQSTTWDSIAGIPESFKPTTHTHAGGDITGPVANATNAANAARSALADGSQYAFENAVSGTEFYAVWVGNDGGFHLGRNTSSRRYKQNIRDHAPDPAEVLKLRPVKFDRIPHPPLLAAKDEWGLIAEEVQDVLPEAVQWFKGEIDGVRYEMIGLALVPVVKEQAKQLASQAAQITKLTTAVRALGGTV